MRAAAAAAALCTAAWLAGCATPAPRDGASPWTTGRLSVMVQAGPGQDAHSMSAAFELRGDGRGGELNLNSPLGTRLASARWAPGLAVLSTALGEQTFPDLQALSRQALGEALPLDALPDWLAGRPWALAPHQPQPAGFAQLGWQVDLTRQAEGWVLARRDAPPAITLRVKLDTEP